MALLFGFYYRSAEEIVDGETDFREGGRRDGFIALHFEKSSVVAASRISVDKQYVFVDVLNPHLRNTGLGIKRNLYLPIVRKRGIGHFHNQQDIRRCCSPGSI